MNGKKTSLNKIFCAPVKPADLTDPLSAWGKLAADFPHIELVSGVPRQDIPDLFITVEQWKSKIFNFSELDRRLDALVESQGGPFGLVLVGWGDELARTVREVLTRCQRWTDRRNEASRSPLFDRVLAKHREVHDLARPLVRADYNHALDTWHWVLRLKPDAGLAEQLAALLHPLKDRHGAHGAELAEALLADAGIDEATRQRTARWITGPECPPSLLNDADALSFFSLDSVSYLDRNGLVPTRKKVSDTVRRLRPEARRHLCRMRLPPEVTAAMQETLHELEAPQRVA